MEKVKMEKLSICRICLDDNVCVNLVNNAQLQDIFERLTSTPFQTNDMRPLTLCYICHAQLNTIYRFTVKCLKAEEILTDMLSQIHTVIQGNRVVPKLTVIRRAVLNQLVYTETQLIDIDSSVPNVETVDVKEEIQINFEGAMKWEDQSLQGPSKMTDSEQEDEEVPPDPMESMPLTNMKTERDEEVDGTGKSLMKVAPNAKQPKPVVCKSKRNVKVESKLNDTIEILILNDKIQINGKNYINITSNSGVTATNEAVNDSKSDVDKYKLQQKTVQESNINDVQNKSRVYGKSRVCLRAKKELICDVCKQSFNHKSKLKSHIRMAHTLKTPQLCKICHKTFSNKYSLKAHTLIHSGSKPYACDVCPKSFNRKDSLIIHTRSHSGEKPYVCAVCNKGFPDKSHLITHSRIHSDESPHVCDECGNSYTTKSSLVQHKNTHTGEKPYMCDVCNKGFTQKGYLKIHSRTHTGDKPYVCDVCGKGFTHNSSLHVHSRSHTGQKPYSCEVCWKTFTLKHALVRHSRIHTGERQFVCNICNKSFSKRQNLLSHTRNQKCEKPSTRLL